MELKQEQQSALQEEEYLSHSASPPPTPSREELEQEIEHWKERRRLFRVEGKLLSSKENKTEEEEELSK